MISNIIEKDFEIIKYKILTINLKLFYNTPIVMCNGCCKLGEKNYNVCTSFQLGIKFQHISAILFYDVSRLFLS